MADQAEQLEHGSSRGLKAAVAILAPLAVSLAIIGTQPEWGPAVSNAAQTVSTTASNFIDTVGSIGPDTAYMFGQIGERLAENATQLKLLLAAGGTAILMSLTGYIGKDEQ